MSGGHSGARWIKPYTSIVVRHETLYNTLCIGKYRGIIGYFIVLLYAYSVYYTQYTLNTVFGGMFYSMYTCKNGCFFRVEGPPYGVSNLH